MTTLFDSQLLVEAFNKKTLLDVSMYHREKC